MTISDAVSLEAALPARRSRL